MSDSSPAEGGDRATACPDPLFSANLYLSGYLDQAVEEVALPFWQSLQEGRGAGLSAQLWLMRYARRGEHLKFRIFAPEADRARLRGKLDEIATAFLARRPEADPETTRRHRETAPPIDLEDDGPGLHPDGTLLWTTYRRSAVSLGEEPLTSDDRYVAHLVGCLSRATDLMLTRMVAEGSGPLNHQQAQGLLVQAVVQALGVWRPDRPERSRYLRYHRDWLLRALARRSARGTAEPQLQRVVDRFNDRLRSLGPKIGKLRTALEVPDEAAGEAPPGRGWSHALARLRTHLDRDLRWPKRALDPFAPEPGSVPLFKVLHGLANQLGLTPLNEAFTHHLLLVAGAGDEVLGWPVRLVPPGRESRRFPNAPPRQEETPTTAPPPSTAHLGLAKDNDSKTGRFEAFIHADLLAACGDEARSWIDEFRRHWPLAETAFDALGHLRKHDLDTGLRRLSELETSLRALDIVDPSIAHLLWRWYFAALAYHAYLREDLPAARCLLDRADRAVRSAVGGHRFLVIFALQCVDFRFQRARIARRERRWDDVRRHLRAVREMWRGETPFCRLDDGREIHLGEIQDFCAALPLSDEQRAHLAQILERTDFSSIDQSEQHIYVLPETVIAYP